ncbi:MAG: prepilin-type N-terminal cleavage/methylation domain-containing protein [Nitrospirota bacterium]
MENETVRIIRKHPSRAAPQSMLKQAKGFTLIELMLAVSIVGVLASLAVPNYLDSVEKARVAKTISELHGLTKEIKGFALGAQQYPNSLADIGRSTMLDPWGTPYQYYKINCGIINDIGSLARLKLRKKDSPRVIPAADSLFTHSNGHISLAIDNGGHQHLLHFVQGAGGGNGGGNGGGGNGGGGGPPCGGVGGARKDRFLVPINSDFDIYSMGKDKDTVAPLNPPKSHDDIIRASDGGFYGLAKNF